MRTGKTETGPPRKGAMGGVSRVRGHIIGVWILLAMSFGTKAQETARPDIASTVEALLAGDPGTRLCFDDSALAMAARLGIQYANVDRKCMISYGIEDSVKTLLRQGTVAYTVETDSAAGEYRTITITAPAVGLSRTYVFRNGCLTSPLLYHTRGWPAIPSRYFRFVVSDSALTNPAAIAQLDAFVREVGDLLLFSPADYDTLERQKILYYLCKDTEQIRELTGSAARGMANLAYDTIVSTYNTHKHELVHLLVNYKLRRPGLYAHPFLQEGLAVALGGRGGLSAGVVERLGGFLHESEMLSYTDILRRTEFNANDASLTYPVAGLYSRFLLETMGGSRYLELYARHCGSAGDPPVEEVGKSELPPEVTWKEYLGRLRPAAGVRFRVPESSDRLIASSDSGEVYDGGEEVLMLVRRRMLFGGRMTSRNYESNIFADLFPGAVYNGEHYACVADSQSVSVYDLWTNTLIASYAASFETSPSPVPQVRGMFSFAVPKRLLVE